jgi:hypothetical protein
MKFGLKFSKVIDLEFTSFSVSSLVKIILFWKNKGLSFLGLASPIGLVTFKIS